MSICRKIKTYNKKIFIHFPLNKVIFNFMNSPIINYSNKFLFYTFCKSRKIPVRHRS